ncbi:MAG: PQQ-binding-like beta-propeller repeat protein [Deltaproteobacteria bacterium]|nr:PQQ-binding-like beta-propeller repeat protein [Deltaproteobacteria bacterium]
MAILDQISCPKCGASVKLSPGQEFYSCPYCKATSHIHEAAPPPGAQPLNMPGQQPFGMPGQAPYGMPGQPPYPMGPMMPPPMPAYRVRSGGNPGAVIGVAVGLVSMIAVGAVVAVGAGTAAFTARRSKPPTTMGGPTVTAVAPSAPEFQFTDRPLLFDVNGDGVQDLIGTCRKWVPVEENWIGAYSGADGSALWSIPTQKEMAQWDARRAIAGDKLVVADSLGKVTAYGARNGKPAWTATLGEKPREVCVGTDFVGIDTADKQKRVFALSDGAPRPPAPKGSCKPTWTSGTDDGPGYRIIGWSDFDDVGLPSLHSIQGMDAHRALVPEDGRLRFMMGSKSPGTQVAMVAAVDGKKVVWKGLVPGVDPLTTTVNVTTQVAALSQGKLVIPYTMSDHRSVRIACLDAATGARSWDVDVPGVTNSVTHGIAIAGNQVFYSTWTSVHVLNLANGSHRWFVGRD